MTHETRQILEIAPEAVDLFRRKIDNAGAFRVNSVVAAAAQLHGAHHVERSDGQYIRCSEGNASELCFGIRGGNAEAGQIQRITGHARPNAFSRLLLSKYRDARTELAQTVQSY